MKTLKTSQEYFSELVTQHRLVMNLPEAFERAKRIFEEEKGMLAPYTDSESFRTSRRSRK